MTFPPFLSPGDRILIVSPGKAIESSHIEYAKQYFGSLGFVVEVGKHALGSFNYFSGTDQERLDDFQWALDHPDAKAIVCARGGYGCVRIVGKLRWANFLRHPKWIAGFSDVTVLHAQAQRYGIASLHSTMPLNFRENTPEALNSLVDALTGKQLAYNWKSNDFNKPGEAEGMLVGGNLSILYSLLATPQAAQFDGSILFIEDVGEQLYHLDRMLHAFSLSGKLDKISGLIVGGMTDMRDTSTPSGFKMEQIIRDHLSYSKIPVAFDSPVGHIEDNRTFICGSTARLAISNTGVTLVQQFD